MFKKMLCILFLFPALVMAEQFTEGKEYQILSSPRVMDKKKNEPVITEFFSYACPWCYKMETPLHEWMSKTDKSFELERIPVVFKADWDLYAKAYYTAKTLALSDKLNPLLFKAIQDKKQPLASKQAMIDFFVAHGVDREIARSAFENSSSIEMHVSNGMALMAQYQINAVPAFVVNNKYKTDLQMAGSPERLFAILDYLMRKST